jgi:penicillin-binding protein 1C
MLTNLARKRENFKRKFFTQKSISYFLFGLIIFIIIGFILSFLVFAWYSRSLPEPGKVKRSSGFSTVFLDRDDKVIYEMYKDENRIPIDIKDIPEYLKKGTIAIEDKNFYTHGGFSITGIIRGVFVSSILKGRAEGGSTLTQQLIKNSLLSSERTVTRKIKEFILAVEVERRYTKDQILGMYLNEAPYGGSFYGVESAAKGYFGKSAKDLNLVESAILAGMPQNPSVYSPFIGKPDAFVGRATDVLRRMREDKYITADQEKKALADLKLIKFTEPKVGIKAAHFVFYVRDQLIKLYGEKIMDQGLKIKTTLSLEVQDEIEKITKEEIGKLKGLNATNAGVVVLDSETNEILGMVGSYDYNDEKFGKFNTTLGLRQPGSSIKPITYALAFEKGYTPSTVLMDVKTTFPKQGEKEYEPVNYDGKFRGPVQLRFALGNSLNIPAVKLLAMLGVKDFLTTANSFGLDTFEPNDANMKRFGLAITLGGGESKLIDMTSAYSIFARGGIRKNYSSLIEVKDYNGKDIYKAESKNEKRVLSEGSSFLISHILSDNIARSAEFGLNSYLNIPGKTVAVKTGTTDDKRDNWAIGFTKNITVGVWVGNNDNSAMNPAIASGATGASPIFYRTMISLLKKYKDGIMDKPANVEAVEIDSYLGGLPKDGQPKRTEYFIKGTEPKDISPAYKRLRISKNNGKLANDLEVRLGEYDFKDFVVFEEKDPISTDGRNRWQEGIEEWRKGQGDDRFKYPTETSTTKIDDVAVQIKAPEDKKQYDNTDITLSVKITSIEDIKKVEIFINGNSIKIFNENKKEFDENLKDRLSDNKTYEIKVRAENNKGKVGESTVRIGIKRAWDSNDPTPTPSPKPTKD